VVPEGVAEVTLRMQSDPVRLATLQVTTSRIDRRASGYAGTVRVFRQEDLAAMWYPNVAQMLESRARVQPTRCRGYSTRGRLTCVYSRGSVVQSRLVIDEAPWLGGTEDLRDFQLADVARVEVFGNGREIRVYTRQFMDWVSNKPYVPTPLVHFW
jgi:outer membrane cobalamin receptor